MIIDPYPTLAIDCRFLSFLSPRALSLTLLQIRYLIANNNSRQFPWPIYLCNVNFNDENLVEALSKLINFHYSLSIIIKFEKILRKIFQFYPYWKKSKNRYFLINLSTTPIGLIGANPDGTYSYFYNSWLASWWKFLALSLARSETDRKCSGSIFLVNYLSVFVNKLNWLKINCSLDTNYYRCPAG